MAYGDFTMLLPDHDTIYAFIRAYESTRLLVLANFSSEPVGFSNLSGAGLEEWKDAELILRNYPAVDGVLAPLPRVGGPGACALQEASHHVHNADERTERALCFTFLRTDSAPSRVRAVARPGLRRRPTRGQPPVPVSPQWSAA